jgi:hypothetical protein
MDKDFLIKIAVSLGVLVLIYFVITKLFSTSGGVLFGAGSQGSNQTVIDTTTEINQNKQIETLPKSTIQSMANSIFQKGYFADTLIESNDTAGIVSNMQKMQNDKDVLQLINAFGTHNRFAFGIPVISEMDLFAFCKSVLSQDEINSINANWKAKNIQNTL